MELWIRSQKNEILRPMLLKVNELEIGDYDEDMNCIVANNLYCVGVYKTKERALEVLDEIQKILNPMIIFNNCKCTQDIIESIKETGACFVTNDAHIEQVSTCVYEIPEE